MRIAIVEDNPVASRLVRSALYQSARKVARCYAKIADTRLDQILTLTLTSCYTV